MKEFIMNMFSEKNNVSMMRFCVSYVVIMIVSLYVTLNIIAAVKGNGGVNISTQDLVLVLGSLGIKMGQKRIEVKKQNGG
ncbi:MAG: hypothetical protein ACTSO3_16885 [Candidatus Heimdallarchaeaceae archaeon]